MHSSIFQKLISLLFGRFRLDDFFFAQEMEMNDLWSRHPLVKIALNGLPDISAYLLSGILLRVDTTSKRTCRRFFYQPAQPPYDRIGRSKSHTIPSSCHLRSWRRNQ